MIIVELDMKYVTMKQSNVISVLIINLHFLYYVKKMILWGSNTYKLTFLCLEDDFNLLRWSKNAKIKVFFFMERTLNLTFRRVTQTKYIFLKFQALFICEFLSWFSDWNHHYTSCSFHGTMQTNKHD